MKKVKKCNYEMEKVVNSDGSTEWKTFLDVRKSFVFLVFCRFPRIHTENEKSIEKVKSEKVKSMAGWPGSEKGAITTLRGYISRMPIR